MREPWHYDTVGLYDVFLFHTYYRNGSRPASQLRLLGLLLGYDRICHTACDGASDVVLAVEEKGLIVFVVDESDLGGGWWEVGAGANFNLSDATHLYLDFEKAIAGEADVEWKWNAGVRYSF